jgi:hypothetical protein
MKKELGPMLRVVFSVLLAASLASACLDGGEKNDGDDTGERGGCCNEGSDADSDADSDSDSDVDQCPDQDSSCIMCVPDPPGSCDDFTGMGSDGVLGCCSSADGGNYYCLDAAVASDDCSDVGCCLEVYLGDPVHVCCGTGDG